MTDHSSQEPAMSRIKPLAVVAVALLLVFKVLLASGKVGLKFIMVGRHDWTTFLWVLAAIAVLALIVKGIKIWVASRQYRQVN
jgi:hypothetical protein